MRIGLIYECVIGESRFTLHNYFLMMSSMLLLLAFEINSHLYNIEKNKQRLIRFVIVREWFIVATEKAFAGLGT